MTWSYVVMVCYLNYIFCTWFIYVNYVIALWFVCFCLWVYLCHFIDQLKKTLAFGVFVIFSGDCTFGFTCESILLGLGDVAIEMGWRQLHCVHWFCLFMVLVLLGDFLSRLRCKWECWHHVLLKLLKPWIVIFITFFKSRLNVIEWNVAWFLQMLFLFWCCFWEVLQFSSASSSDISIHLNAFDRITDLVETFYQMSLEILFLIPHGWDNYVLNFINNGCYYLILICKYYWCFL